MAGPGDSMRQVMELTSEEVVVGNSVPDAGFYSWDIPDDKLYADSALSSLFGLDSDAAEKGLPIVAYLARVHPEDRPELAKAIRDSIVSHVAQQETYRVLNSMSLYVRVASYGRVFRDESGNPVRFVGIIIPADNDEAGTAH